MGRVRLCEALAEMATGVRGGWGSGGGTMWGDAGILSWLLMFFNHPCNFMQTTLVRIYLNVHHFTV